MSDTCNADYRHPCDANDGEPCDRCAEGRKESEAAARRAWDAASPQERDPRKYEQDLRDAGRMS
jgi:hypothetical protein